MYHIGIDLGGTNIAAGILKESDVAPLLFAQARPADDSQPLVRGDSCLLYKDSIPTHPARSAEEIIADAASLARTVAHRAGVDFRDVTSIGFVSPGTVNPLTGIVEFAGNVPFTNFDVKSHLRRHTGIEKITVDNDANAAAYAEAVVGAGHGVRDFLMITIGTGIGGAYVSAGDVQRGFNFAGGEFGHTVIVVGGEKCTCGRLGCAEAYCSVNALIRMTLDEMARADAAGERTLLKDIAEKTSGVNGKTAFDAMREGDKVAERVVSRYIYYLATALTNYINIFQPEILAIGGGISKEGEYLLSPLRRIIYSEMFNHRQSPDKYTKIVTASLGGDAGVIGAALLAVKEWSHKK
ncbi:MAG TPA: ROK family protein [Bacillota bacterium]|nr:ROK family protein [Bacillota bacterium]